MEDVNKAPEEMQDIQHTEAIFRSNSTAESEAPLMDRSQPSTQSHEIKQTKKIQNFIKKHKKKLLALIVLLIIIGVAVTVSVTLPHSAKPTAAPQSKTTTNGQITSTSKSKTTAAPSKPTSDVQSKTTSAPQSTPPVTALQIMPTAALQIAGCPPIVLSEHLSVNCSNGQNIGSLCSFSCEGGFHLQGSFSITCQSSIKWSAPPPICVDECPPCYTGQYCKQSTSWKVLEIYISDTPFAKFEAIYAGFELFCRSTLHKMNIFHWRYDCECTDNNSGVMEKCGKYKSPRTACETALAQLVREMVKLKQYPATCDPADMPTKCSS